MLIAFLSLAVLYVAFQARYLLAGPAIELTAPLSVVQTERRVEIVGQATNIVNLTLNGRQIYTDGEGYFSEVLVLENGFTGVTVAAQDRFGRQTADNLTLVYRPPVERLDEELAFNH